MGIGCRTVYDLEWCVQFLIGADGDVIHHYVDLVVCDEP